MLDNFGRMGGSQILDDTMGKKVIWGDTILERGVLTLEGGVLSPDTVCKILTTMTGSFLIAIN